MISTFSPNAYGGSGSVQMGDPGLAAGILRLEQARGSTCRLLAAQLIFRKEGPGGRYYQLVMKSFLYQCPVSGFVIQSWVAEESIATDPETEKSEYIGVQCPLCNRTHLVNPTSGRVLRHERVPKSK
jgi:hypothetical protein